MKQESNQVKPLQLLHKSMTIGQVIFLIIALVLFFMKRLPVIEDDKIVLFRTAGLVAGGIWFIAFFLFNKIIRSIGDKPVSPKERFDLYRKSTVTQWAVLEIFVMVILVCFALTGNNALYVIGFILVILFIRLYPTHEKISSMIGISQHELEGFEPDRRNS